MPQVLGRKTLGQPRSMRSLHFLIENNEKPEKCWSNGTKEEMKLQISIEIYLKFSKNLSFQLACGIQWWPNFYMQFFFAQLEQQFFFRARCLIARWSTRKKRATKTQPLTTERAKMISFFKYRKRIHLDFLTLIVILFHKRPQNKNVIVMNRYWKRNCRIAMEWMKSEALY